ncbi:pilin [Asanoa sp. NPDC049518]|uniref:pilin n=1 Tax=unclassified Asanoa TaxID=2685164 RepID=UPI00344467EF
MHTSLSLLADALAVAAPPTPKSIPEVIDGITGWVMAILAAVATMFFVIGALLYMGAGSENRTEQAKGYFKRSLQGYALAVLSPVILQILQGILGG